MHIYIYIYICTTTTKIWPDYYRNPCICIRWPFSSARGSGARVILGSCHHAYRSINDCVTGHLSRLLQHLHLLVPMIHLVAHRVAVTRHPRVVRHSYGAVSTKTASRIDLGDPVKSVKSVKSVIRPPISEDHRVQNKYYYSYYCDY